MFVSDEIDNPSHFEEIIIRSNKKLNYYDYQIHF